MNANLPFFILVLAAALGVPASVSPLAASPREDCETVVTESTRDKMAELLTVNETAVADIAANPRLGSPASNLVSN